MKLFIRISALTLVVAAALAGSYTPDATNLASNSMHSSVPGGGGPMPSCNPFTSSCPTIR
jgi:hypothetical protein